MRTHDLHPSEPPSPVVSRGAEGELPGSAEDCRRQSALVANDPAEQDILNAIEATADRSGWQ